MKSLLFSLLFLSPVFSGEYFSQYGQDKYLHEKVFKGKQEGVFIEIGAYDGITLSNTCFFERALGWTGVCVEPLPRVFEELEENRGCYCLKGAVSNYTGVTEFCCVSGFESLPGKKESIDPKHIAMLSGILSEYDPRHVKRIDYELGKMVGNKETVIVDVYSFNDLMDKYGYTKVDFVSIDTEGGEEKILRAIDFDKYSIDVFCVEKNYKNKVEQFLSAKGYRLIRRLGCDYIFVKNELFDDHEGS